MLKLFTDKLRMLVIITLVGGAFIAGNIVGWTARPLLASQAPPEFELFWQAWDIVLEHFVDQDQIDFQQMTYGAIEGMLNTLGDQNHTAFMTPAVARMQAEALEGSFEGIGAYVSTDEGDFRIVTPIRGSPAEAAGILAGDRIIAVDGISIIGMDEWNVIDRVRGPAGTTVVLTIVRSNIANPFEILVRRDRIELESVLWAPIPSTDLAYIQITQFADKTATELITVLQDIALRPSGENAIQGIVLDLRNNPGGYLYESIRAATQFLEEDLIILHERDADGQLTTHYSRGHGHARELPLVVLVNSGTASAAEILSGALQKNQRATLIGTTTLGTGTVLQQFSLTDGSVIRLGVTNWLTPDFQLIKNQGIQPDIRIQQTETVKLVDTMLLTESTEDSPWSPTDHQFNAALLHLRFSQLTIYRAMSE